MKEELVITRVLIDLLTKLGFSTHATVFLITLNHHIQNTPDCKAHIIVKINKKENIADLATTHHHCNIYLDFIDFNVLKDVCFGSILFMLFFKGMALHRSGGRKMMFSYVFVWKTDECLVSEMSRRLHFSVWMYKTSDLIS